MQEEIELAKQWLAKAENDLLDADNSLSSVRIPFDMVCFHCQQAAEKMLKAYLIANNTPYPITNDLLEILEKILPLNSNARELEDILAFLTPYAVQIRYPSMYSMPSAKDAAKARKAAAQVRQWLESVCPILF
jgi:HEPN domain-containing protein